MKLFDKKPSVIGVIHVDALPGTPKYSGEMTGIIDKAVSEARVYCDNGIDALAIENMHDVPYLNREAGHEVTAAMSVIGFAVRQAVNVPVGIQILAGANRAALAAAIAAKLDFIRAEGFVFGHLADEGLISSDAGELLRYRKQLGGEDISILCDIKKKHSSHAVTSDITIEETGKAAEFFLADGVIVTGKSTGEETEIREVKSVSEAVDIPVLVGSGITIDNLDQYAAHADGFIVGSWFKMDGIWSNPVDAGRVKMFMDKITSLRSS